MNEEKVVDRIAREVRRGNVAEVRRLLDAFPECRAFLNLGDELLERGVRSWNDYARKNGQDKVADVLLFDYPDPVLREIYSAATSGDVHQLGDLLKRHPNYARHWPGGLVELLGDAARGGHANVVELLLEMGTDINGIDGWKSTPLNRAVNFANPELIKYLLIKGADPNIGRPIIGAISREPEELALELVKLLVEHGADVNREFTVFGDENNTFTALEWAVNYACVANYLRSKGAVERKKKPAEGAAPKNLAEEIVAYFHGDFGPPNAAAQIEIVPVEPAIAIHVIPPADDRPHVTLFTTGMSENAMQVPEGTDDFRFAELFIQLPANWPLDKKSLSESRHGWPVQWLRAIAKYPHQRKTWLGGPVTIIANGDPPEPLAPGLNFTSILVMADRQFTSRDGRKIYFYRLTPLYTEERNLEINEGIDALMRAFDQFKVPSVVDLSRVNVAAQ